MGPCARSSRFKSISGLADVRTMRIRAHGGLGMKTSALGSTLTVVRWEWFMGLAENIRAKVQQGLLPPWHACEDPGPIWRWSSLQCVR